MLAQPWVDRLLARRVRGDEVLKAASRLAAGAALAALLALSGPSGANDSIANFEAGGLVLTKNTAIEMRSEDLYISDKAVRVKYVFMNTSPKDVTVTVAFPMPDIAWDAVGDANVDIPAAVPNFLAFTTTVDGKPVNAQVEQKAMDQNGVDRTAYLLAIGVPLDNTVQATDDALNRLPKVQQDALVKLGLAAWPDEGTGIPHKLSAGWSLKTTFFWQQTFPAGRAVAVEHNYTPSVGRAYGWGPWGSASAPQGFGSTPFVAEKFCVDDAFLTAFQKARPSDSKIPFTFENIDYVLVTGANWKAPIGDFRMVIDKGAPANLVSFCGTGVRKTGPTTFEVHYTNFTPTSNVSVLIVNPNWRSPGGAPTAVVQGIYTPQTGNPERTAVMDGLRRFFNDGGLRFVVKTLKVAHTDKGAIAYTEAMTATGIGGVFLLTSDARGMWNIGWSEGHGASDCATVAHSFGSAKVLIESYGIKPEALIPDFTENNYNSLQQQARQHPHDTCAFGLVGDAGESSPEVASQETAPTPTPSGPAAQTILRWFTTDRSLGCANQQENDPCTVEDNGPVFEVYYGDSTGDGPQADALAFVYYFPYSGGKMIDVNLAYFHRDGGGYRFIKTFPEAAGWEPVKGTTVRFLPGKARFTRQVKQADDPRCCATGRATYTVTLNPAPGAGR